VRSSERETQKEKGRNKDSKRERERGMKQESTVCMDQHTQSPCVHASVLCVEECFMRNHKWRRRGNRGQRQRCEHWKGHFVERNVAAAVVGMFFVDVVILHAVVVVVMAAVGIVVVVLCVLVTVHCQLI